MLVLPRIGIPAALILVTIVASYGGIQPCRILDPAVVGMPLVVAMSFTAIGTPARMCSSSPAVRRWSILRAVASAPSVSRCRKALTEPSTASIRSRCAWVASTALISLRDRRSASLAALARVISEVTAEPLFGGTRRTDSVVLGGQQEDDGVQSSSRIRGTEKRCCSEAGAPASASCAVRLRRTTSGRVTLRIGIGWDVAGTSSVATSFTRATDSRMMASSPDILSSSASLRSMRASMARWATSSREIADMPSSLVGRPEPYAACSGGRSGHLLVQGEVTQSVVEGDPESPVGATDHPAALDDRAGDHGRSRRTRRRSTIPAIKANESRDLVLKQRAGIGLPCDHLGSCPLHAGRGRNPPAARRRKPVGGGHEPAENRCQED